MGKKSEAKRVFIQKATERGAVLKTTVGDVSMVIVDMLMLFPGVKTKSDQNLKERLEKGSQKMRVFQGLFKKTGKRKQTPGTTTDDGGVDDAPPKGELPFTSNVDYHETFGDVAASFTRFVQKILRNTSAEVVVLLWDKKYDKKLKDLEKERRMGTSQASSDKTYGALQLLDIIEQCAVRTGRTGNLDQCAFDVLVSHAKRNQGIPPSFSQKGASMSSMSKKWQGIKEEDRQRDQLIFERSLKKDMDTFPGTRDRQMSGQEGGEEGEKGQRKRDVSPQKGGEDEGEGKEQEDVVPLTDREKENIIWMHRMSILESMKEKLRTIGALGDAESDISPKNKGRKGGTALLQEGRLGEGLANDEERDLIARAWRTVERKTTDNPDDLTDADWDRVENFSDRWTAEITKDLTCLYGASETQRLLERKIQIGWHEQIPINWKALAKTHRKELVQFLVRCFCGKEPLDLGRRACLSIPLGKSVILDGHQLDDVEEYADVLREDPSYTDDLLHIKRPEHPDIQWLHQRQAYDPLTGAGLPPHENEEVDVATVDCHGFPLLLWSERDPQGQAHRQVRRLFYEGINQQGEADFAAFVYPALFPEHARKGILLATVDTDWFYHSLFFLGSREVANNRLVEATFSYCDVLGRDVNANPSSHSEIAPETGGGGGGGGGGGEKELKLTSSPWWEDPQEPRLWFLDSAPSLSYSFGTNFSTSILLSINAVADWIRHKMLCGVQNPLHVVVAVLETMGSDYYTDDSALPGVPVAHWLEVLYRYGPHLFSPERISLGQLVTYDSTSHEEILKNSSLAWPEFACVNTKPFFRLVHLSYYTAHRFRRRKNPDQDPWLRSQDVCDSQAPLLAEILNVPGFFPKVPENEIIKQRLQQLNLFTLLSSRVGNRYIPKELDLSIFFESEKHLHCPSQRLLGKTKQPKRGKQGGVPSFSPHDEFEDSLQKGKRKRKRKEPVKSDDETEETSSSGSSTEVDDPLPPRKRPLKDKLM